MKTQKQTINEMIAQIIAEARKLGYSEATIWRNITPKFQTVAVYYEKRGVCFYDPAITRELVDLQKERLDREESIRSRRITRSSSTFSWIIKAIARIPGTMWCG